MNALRSSCMFNSSGNHEKCASKTFCNFCLLRSLVFKINMPKGRLLLQPVEAEYQLNETDSMSIVKLLEKFLNNASQSNVSFSNVIKPAWTCSCCRKQNSSTDGSIIHLDNVTESREINRLLKAKYRTLKEQHLEIALSEFVLHSQNFELTLESHQTSCAFYSSKV